MTLGYNALVGDPATYAAANARRHVFYSFPRGAATLVGLLSLMESEPTDGPHYDWHEKRFQERKMYLVDLSDGATGPWMTSAGAAAGATFSLVASTTYIIKIRSTETLANWSIGERIRIVRQRYSTTSFKDVYASVSAIDSVNNKVTIVTDAGTTTVTANNSPDTDEGNLIQTLGVPMAEGSRSPGSRTPLYPIKPGNYTQIMRTPMAFTRTELNQPMFFDQAGLLRSTRRDTAIDHMIQWENALLFGRRSETTVTDTDGTSTIVRTVGGLKWWLEEWEKVNGGSLFAYRPGGTAQTANTDAQKRIIAGDSNGELNNALWKDLERRIFKSTMSSSGEKLVIGGSLATSAIIEYYRAKTAIRVTRPFEAEGLKLNFELRTIDTDYGTLHVKSHPRFNDDEILEKQAAIVDLPNLKLRPMVNADMHVNENIQDNDFDGRKDEYFTEMGLEVRFPESHLWLENVDTITTS